MNDAEIEALLDSSDVNDVACAAELPTAESNVAPDDGFRASSPPNNAGSPRQYNDLPRG